MPRIFTGSYFMIFIALLTLSATDSFSQKRASKNRQTESKPISREQANEIAKNHWIQRITRCGDSAYFFRRDKSEEITLYEVKGLTIESQSFSPEELGPVGPRETRSSGKLLWSGNSRASFESYRKLRESESDWGSWFGKGSDTAYHELYENARNFSSGWTASISCAEVDKLTFKTDSQTLPTELTNMQFKSLDGRNFTLKELEGKVVLINLWATWCGPCRLEIPELVKLQKKYQDRGLVIIGLNVDAEEKEAIEAFREKYEVSYPLVTSEGSFISEFSKITGAGMIPQSFLIGKDGRLITFFKGYVPQKSKFLMEKMIGRLPKE